MTKDIHCTPNRRKQENSSITLEMGLPLASKLFTHKLRFDLCTAIVSEENFLKTPPYGSGYQGAA